MNEDLLFCLIPYSEWKVYSESGRLEPPYFEETGYIRCYDGDHIEKAANKDFSDHQKLFLLILDPNKIAAPIKNLYSDDIPFIALYESIPIDVIIDRIPLVNDPDDGFTISVSHYE